MGHRILVADDESTIRSVICEVLEEDGYEVCQAGNGEEALERFRSQPFPIVVTDIYMGKMTGLDLLAEIKLIDSECLVVVITSNASLDTATQALRAGAYDYLVKPFDDLSAISSVVRRAADKIELLRSNRSLMERLQRNAEELETLNLQLREVANRDGLTGLYNHRYFMEALEREIARSHRHAHHFALLFMDIDHFKHYNDTQGHVAGDKLLQELAELFRQRTRKDSVAARYGGEEFVLLLPETDRAGARALGESLRGLVERHEFHGRERQPLGTVTLSIGVAMFPGDATDGTLLITRADEALYRAKHSGRNAVRSWTAGCTEEPAVAGAGSVAGGGEQP